MAINILVKDTKISIGDTLKISQRIKEGEKERTQIFEGVLIAIKGGNGERTITVRRIASGAVGVEKIFPVDLPSLVAVKVVKSGQVRRSKLYYLRKRTGKLALKLNEKQKKQPTGEKRRKSSLRVSVKKKV